MVMMNLQNPNLFHVLTKNGAVINWVFAKFCLGWQFSAHEYVDFGVRKLVGVETENVTTLAQFGWQKNNSSSKHY